MLKKNEVNQAITNTKNMMIKHPNKVLFSYPKLMKARKTKWQTKRKSPKKLLRKMQS